MLCLSLVVVRCQPLRRALCVFYEKLDEYWFMSNKDNIVSWVKNAERPGTIESHGSAFISSLCTLFLLWFFLMLLMWSIGVADDKKLHDATSLILSENFGVFSFLSSTLAIVSGNSFYLLASNLKWAKRTNMIRLHMQNYLIGLSGTVFVIGYFGFDLLENGDFIWTLGFVFLTWLVTWFSTYVKVNFKRPFEIFTGVGYLAVTILVFVCSKLTMS
ncbi:hypothetical protein DLR62_16075 [Vibrio tarriae]|nr:hypothetical protein DLR62_16075 [Vibrio tarriae]